ncbi:MAG TPA: hypothetical protein VFA27_09345 [Vicinamibacterales bacterium]|nr:hypothetical protein [Vicinamibacterales bacterium]
MPDAAVVIDPREPQILERPRSEGLDEAFLGEPGIDRAAGDLFEEIKELFV